jgi:type IV pilus assembly protein PilM
MVLVARKQKSFPIGINLGSSAVKVVQMGMSDEGLRLLAAASEAIPRDCREDMRRRMDCHAACMRSLVKGDAFVSRQCVISLPAEAAFIHHVKIPKLPKADMAAAVESDLQGKLPMPVQDAIVRYVVAGDVYGDGGAKQEVIAIAAARGTVESYLAMARRAKLDVVAINAEPCAIVECFARLFQKGQDEGRTTMYVDIGEMTTKVVLARGGSIAFARDLSIGAKWFDAALAQGLQMPVEDVCKLRQDIAAGRDCSVDVNRVYAMLEEPMLELVEKLTQCMRYHESVFPNQGVERLVLLGGQAYDKRLCQTVAQKLNLAAHIGDPLVKISREGATTFSTGLERAAAQPDWAVAVGLSLGAADAA